MHKDNETGAIDEQRNNTISNSIKTGSRQDNIVALDSTRSHKNPDNRENTESRNEVLLSKALSVLRFRKTRNSLFNDNDLFTDPTWDMVLELYVAELQRVRISLAGLCIGSQLAISTAQRWLKFLESKQLVNIELDINDNQRHFVKLNPIAIDYINTLLSAYP